MREQIQQKKAIYLENTLNSEDIKNQLVSNIKNSLFDLAMSIGIKSNQKLIPLQIIKLISDKVQKELTSLIYDNSTKNNLNKIIKNQFQKILSSIKKLNYY